MDNLTYLEKKRILVSFHTLKFGFLSAFFTISYNFKLNKKTARSPEEKALQSESKLLIHKKFR